MDSSSLKSECDKTEILNVSSVIKNFENNTVKPKKLILKGLNKSKVESREVPINFGNVFRPRRTTASYCFEEYTLCKKEGGAVNGGRNVLPLPVQALIDVYEKVLDHLEYIKGTAKYNKYAIQNLVMNVILKERNLFVNSEDPSVDIFRRCINIILDDRSQKYLYSTTPVKEESSIVNENTHLKVIEKYNLLMESKEEIIKRSSKLNATQNGHLKWNKALLAKYKDAFKKFGYGMSSHRKISEYVGEDIKSVLFLKYILQKCYKQKNIRLAKDQSQIMTSPKSNIQLCNIKKVDEQPTNVIIDEQPKNIIVDEQPKNIIVDEQPTNLMNKNNVKRKEKLSIKIIKSRPVIEKQDTEVKPHANITESQVNDINEHNTKKKPSNIHNDVLSKNLDTKEDNNPSNYKAPRSHRNDHYEMPVKRFKTDPHNNSNDFGHLEENPDYFSTQTINDPLYYSLSYDDADDSNSKIYQNFNDVDLMDKFPQQYSSYERLHEPGYSVNPYNMIPSGVYNDYFENESQPVLLGTNDYSRSKGLNRNNLNENAFNYNNTFLPSRANMHFQNSMNGQTRIAQFNSGHNGLLQQEEFPIETMSPRIRSSDMQSVYGLEPNVHSRTYPEFQEPIYHSKPYSHSSYPLRNPLQIESKMNSRYYDFSNYDNQFPIVEYNRKGLPRGRNMKYNNNNGHIIKNSPPINEDQLNKERESNKLNQTMPSQYMNVYKPPLELPKIPVQFEF